MNGPDLFWKRHYIKDLPSYSIQLYYCSSVCTIRSTRFSSYFTLYIKKVFLLLDRSDGKLSDYYFELDFKNEIYSFHDSSFQFLSIKQNILITKDLKPWLANVGHLSADRYHHLSELRKNIWEFPSYFTESYLFFPCFIPKTKKTLRLSKSSNLDRTIIYLDTSGRCTRQFWTERGSVFARSKIDLICSNFHDSGNFNLYENATYLIYKLLIHDLNEDISVTSIRAFTTPNIMVQERKQYSKYSGISSRPSRQNVSGSGKNAERLLQENWRRAIVLLTGCILSDRLCTAALHYENRLRSCLTC